MKSHVDYLAADARLSGKFDLAVVSSFLRNELLIGEITSRVGMQPGPELSIESDEAAPLMHTDPSHLPINALVS
jgi:hypothetical protein